ncbi:MAG: alpha/beta fold hydrolase [Rhizobium sp.]|nr:MAG: alpha/beta fold hydrolase [Rhizobium sp.]
MRIYPGILLGLGLLLSACSSSSPTALSGTGAKEEFPSEPALETPQATLDAALHCTSFTHPDKPAVLLVHGTFTAGQEQYEWNYIPLLSARGYDVCAVTYPDRGLGDQQVSAEYVVNALRRMHARSGRKVAMIGHSQGATMPRWAIKWWPSARDAVDDFILQAGPNHGTAIGAPATLTQELGLGALPVGLLPAAFYQFAPASMFVAALNAGDETPGSIDYTTIYTLTDELVEPAQPVPTAALDWQQDNPHVRNVLIQDVCPLQITDHVTIGTTDAVAFALALDAIEHDGPADPVRAGGSALCTNIPIILDPAIASAGANALVTILQSDIAAGVPNPHLVSAEPSLKPYAQ